MGHADDPLRQREARAYQRGRRRLGAAGAALSFVLLAAGSLAGARIAHALATPGPLVVDAFVYLAAVGAVWELAHLPLAIAGWRSSRAHGISRQGLAGWALDQAKGLGIAFVLGGIGLTLVVWAQRLWPHGWWLAVGLGAAATGLLLTLLGPVVILPIFLRSHDLGDGELADELRSLTRSAGVRVRGLRVLEAGRKTSGQNAFVAGVGPTRRIMLFDTLCGPDGELAPERLAETRAVLAHELGHARSGDIWRLVAVGGVGALVVLAAAARLLDALPGSLQHAGVGTFSALPALALCVALCNVPVDVASRAYSRRRERAADRFALGIASGEAFAAALERLCASNLAELEPPRAYELTCMTHPAPAARIAAARGRPDRKGSVLRPRTSQA